MDIFSTFSLKRNTGKIISITEPPKEDGEFAVVDIDTIWENNITGELMQWQGRTCKTYVKTSTGYKMIAQTGVLAYE